MKPYERILLWIPLLSLLAAPLAWGVTGGSIDPTSPIDKQTWVTKIREAQTSLANARLRYDQSVRSYGQARHRNKTQGEAKASMLDERGAASQALTEAERNLEQLLESARRAGVPPGWVREAIDPSSGPANQRN